MSSTVASTVISFSTNTTVSWFGGGGKSSDYILGKTYSHHCRTNTTSPPNEGFSFRETCSWYPYTQSDHEQGPRVRRDGTFLNRRSTFPCGCARVPPMTCGRKRYTCPSSLHWNVPGYRQLSRYRCNKPQLTPSLAEVYTRAAPSDQEPGIRTRNTENSITDAVHFDWKCSSRSLLEPARLIHYKVVLSPWSIQTHQANT